MTPNELLQGVEDVPWADLDTASGKAADFPELLRLVAADGERSGDAWRSLSERLVQEGSVWSATRYAVPFLARFAAAGIGDASLVIGTLGVIADSGAGDGFEPKEDARLAREAVTGQAGRLLPLLGHPDPAIRVWTAWTLTKCQSPDRVLPALLARWDTERDFVVRAALLKAVETIDRGRAAAAAGQVSLADPAGLRLVAAEVSAIGGRAWTSSDDRNATAWCTTGTDLPDWWWADDYAPFNTLLSRLAELGRLEIAVTIATTALRTTADRQSARQARRAAGQLVVAYPENDYVQSALRALLTG